MSKKIEKSESSKLAIFEGEQIRRTLVNEEWYYSIEDVVQALTDTIDVKGYVKDLRRRDESLSEGWGQIATPLPFKTKGGVQKINCADTEGVLREMLILVGNIRKGIC